jgi:hypothetical protein
MEELKKWTEKRKQYLQELQLTNAPKRVAFAEQLSMRELRNWREKLEL